MKMAGASESGSIEPSKAFKRERLRILNACDFCRARKVKCDGGRPACQRCKSRKKSCLYTDTSTAPRKRGLGVRRLAPAPASVFPSPPEEPRSVHVAHRKGNYSKHFDGSPDSQIEDSYYTTHDRFVGEVAATINAKAGASPAATSNLVPFVNAPLFGEVDLSMRPSSGSLKLSRSYSDHLVDIYWQYLDPVEPVIDRELFFLNYDIFHSNAGRLEPTWLSIINLVWALAVQRQESIPQHKRDCEANQHFHRALALLRPEEALWGSESIELVYCLVLMNRYLHCTNNQKKSWMTAGLAIRMAQSLSCHSQQTPYSREGRLKLKLWATCVALDRCVSWSLGSIASASLFSIADRHSNRTPDHDACTRDLELHEIGNQIQMAQIQSRSLASTKLDSSLQYQQEEYCTAAIRLDACLNRWEGDLPTDWSIEALSNGDLKTKPTRHLLHLRLLHTRIFLYRPMLSRVYSEPSSSSSLGGHLIKECAIKCLETAQQITHVVLSAMSPDVSIGILPWWYRIYYLHIAGIHFLAAMCTTHLYNDSIAKSWHTVLAGLRSHEHLSEYIKQCVTTFESLSVRILQARCGNPNLDRLTEIPASMAFDDIFQEMGFDFNHFLYNQDDVFSASI